MEKIGFVEIGKPVPAAVLEVRTAYRVRFAEIRKPFPVVRLGDVTFKLFAGELPEKESLKKGGR